jgi:hypothetical protein
LGGDGVVAGWRVERGGDGVVSLEVCETGVAR